MPEADPSDDELTRRIRLLPSTRRATDKADSRVLARNTEIGSGAANLIRHSRSGGENRPEASHAWLR